MTSCHPELWLFTLGPSLWPILSLFPCLCLHPPSLILHPSYCPCLPGGFGDTTAPISADSFPLGRIAMRSGVVAALALRGSGRLRHGAGVHRRSARLLGAAPGRGGQPTAAAQANPRFCRWPIRNASGNSGRRGGRLLSHRARGAGPSDRQHAHRGHADDRARSQPDDLRAVAARHGRSASSGSRTRCSRCVAGRWSA